MEKIEGQKVNRLIYCPIYYDNKVYYALADYYLFVIHNKF